MIASRRLYTTADQRTVVLEDDPAAAFLLCAVGQELPKGLPDDSGEGDPPQFAVEESPEVPDEAAVEETIKPASTKPTGRHASKPEE